MPQVSLCGQQLNVAPSSQKISETWGIPIHNKVVGGGIPGNKEVKTANGYGVHQECGNYSGSR